ncbi:hypothetical protein, partial [Streptomyces sp. NPDC014793]|uniref:hypothetical protein n=1 Tax=Streptomyces sp. NPDC014793 TaxID=3364914 RepID=UPI0036F770F9
MAVLLDDLRIAVDGEVPHDRVRGAHGVERESGLRLSPHLGVGLDAISVGAILRQSGVMTAALVERMAPEDLWTL